MNQATLRHTQTSLLEVAYLESGPPAGFPLVLIHGWPDDALTWNRVAPRLAEAGCRVICPYLRGCGPTRFLDAATPRSGQLVALGQDLIEFAAALKLERYAVVGHDWGARAAYIACGLDAARISHCVGMSVGYGTNSPGQKLSMGQLQNYWYHWLMATERGRQVVREDRINFTRHVWDIWLPFGKPDESVQGWETARHAQDRIATAMRRLARDEPTRGDIVVVAHGGVGELLMAHLQGVAIGGHAKPQHSGGGCWIEIDRDRFSLLAGWTNIPD